MKAALKAIVISSVVLSAVTANAADYLFRPRPFVVEQGSVSPPVNGGGEETGGEDNGGDGEGTHALSISISAPAVYALTIGKASVSLPLSANGDVSGVSYRAAVNADMPGLTVNSTNGTVSGTPSAGDGHVYRIAVEAVRDGNVAATSQEIDETLRAPLSIDTIPDDLHLAVGDELPSSGISAGALGGDPDSMTWSLVNGPEWMGISGVGIPRAAMLQVVAGEEVSDTALRTVKVKVEDGDGRSAVSAGFLVEALSGPGCEEGPVGSVCASDGSVYVGTYRSKRMYMAPADEPGVYQQKTDINKVDGKYVSWYDGVANTNDMMALSAMAYSAAAQCRSHGSNWYLPSLYEMRDGVIANGNNDLLGSYKLTQEKYWTSTAAWTANVLTQGQNSMSMTNQNPVRCFRQ